MDATADPRRWGGAGTRRICREGIVYLILGGLATSAALGAGGRITDMRGALRAPLREPFGEALLGLLALGLVGYAIWRFLEAFADANREGRTPKASPSARVTPQAVWRLDPLPSTH